MKKNLRKQTIGNYLDKNGFVIKQIFILFLYNGSWIL